MTKSAPAEHSEVLDQLDHSTSLAAGGKALRSTRGAAANKDRRRLDHDVLHELSTIVLLASLLRDSEDLSTENRHRAGMLINEAKWLRTLVQSYCPETVDDLNLIQDQPQLVRLDWMISRLATSTRMQSATRISVDALPAMVYANGIELGRAVRNILWNALDAAGPTGHVAMRISTCGTTAIVEIEDDGPGFGAVASSGMSLGLDIVRRVAKSCGGKLEISGGDLGGCSVRLILTAVPTM
jgi:signal transduction histidine kinase